MKTVYFVCYGNLCRSPFAEKYAALRASELGLEGLRFDGAGIGATRDQPCPKAAITAAREVDVDLTSHLAKHTEEIQPGPEDWVIAMDRFVFGSLAMSLATPLSEVRGPGDSRLHLMMQSLAGDPAASDVGLDVPDPIGQSIATYRECYDLLRRAVDRLLEQITADTG